jgi:stage V sporulation protein R
MVLDGLYHPPHVTIDLERTTPESLWLDHEFEGKPLVRDFVHNTLLGLEFLWGGKVQLDTSEVQAIKKPDQKQQPTLPGMAPNIEAPGEAEVQWQRVRYTMKDRKLSRGLV